MNYFPIECYPSRMTSEQVQWSLGNTTWEPLLHCKDLAALDRYLEVMGVQYPRQLSRCWDFEVQMPTVQTRSLPWFRAAMSIFPPSIPQISLFSWSLLICHSLQTSPMMLILLLGFATSLFVASMDAGDQNEQPGSPHDWSGTTNPGWGSPWGGNWGMNSNMNMANNMASTGPNASIAHPGGTQVPVWPGQFFSQHPNTGPPGMFYPPNWGGYLGQLYQTTKETLHPNNPIGQEDAQMQPQGTSTSKGKKKASKEETNKGSSNDHQSNKRARPLPIGPSTNHLPHMPSSKDRTDDELAGYLSDMSSVKNTKPQKKDTGKTKQLTILPQRIEYLAPRDGTVYLHDSRVHNTTITEGSSVNDWLAFLADRLQSRSGGSASDSSDEESGSDSEPWHPGRLPPSLLSAIVSGHTEHDNGFWGMLGPGFLYIHKYNIVLTNTKAVNAIWAFDSGRGLCPPLGMSQWPNPQGFPMTIREMHDMVCDIKGHQSQWRTNLYLLGEFFWISSTVRLEYRDMAMQATVMRFNNAWSNIREQFESLDPPEFVLMPTACVTSNPRSTNHSTGLVRPINGTIDDWCHYIAHHMHPGGHSTPSRIGMDTSFQVSIPHTWGYLLSMVLSPENDHHGAHSTYARIFAGVVARPQWYSLRITEINSTSLNSSIVIVPLSNVLEHMDWDGLGHDLDEDNVIRHMAANGITQAMVDSAYLYGLTFIDRDVQDLERIRVLCHVQDYESTDKQTPNVSTNTMRPVYDWFHVGEHYVYEWLAERPPLNNTDDMTPMSGSSDTPHPEASVDEDVDMDGRVVGTVPTERSSSAPASVSARQDGVVSELALEMTGSLDADITCLSIMVGMGTNHTSNMHNDTTSAPDKEMFKQA
ncbi:hypothetical protein EDD18DRAFT_1113975 [Armillaria luteobubalina]|uniref:Uncharacterized protein n=1 Tax=Armillaria luteobubalina TaxID=153913 RepID=A0AA39P834_9AGAR|nr:hypothetical protein EDD18DRAFT_1113975 [Armillaria luteobubalina]